MMLYTGEPGRAATFVPTALAFVLFALPMAAFSVLLLFIIFKPTGFFGQRVRKMEV